MNIPTPNILLFHFLMYKKTRYVLEELTLLCVEKLFTHKQSIYVPVRELEWCIFSLLPLGGCSDAGSWGDCGRINAYLGLR